MYYKNSNPENTVKLKLPTGFLVINMKVFHLWEAKYNICWGLLENILEKHHDDFESIAFVPLLIGSFQKRKKGNLFLIDLRFKKTPHVII